MKENKINLINYINMNLNESLLVLEWRNSKSVRKQMDNPDIISKEKHFKFLNYLHNNKKKIYFLVKRNDEYIGCINYQDIYDNDKAELGLFINPKMQGKGIGTLLIKLIEDYAVENLGLQFLVLKVRRDNNQAIKLYKKQSYLQYSIDKNFLYMKKKLSEDVIE